MKIIYNRFIPFKGFMAVNLFGVLFVRKEYEDNMNEHAEVKNIVINHESIHTAQMKELWFIGFYLMYLFYYLFLLAKTGNARTAYRKSHSRLKRTLTKDKLTISQHARGLHLNITKYDENQSHGTKRHAWHAARP